MTENYKQRIEKQAKAVEKYHKTHICMDAKDVLIALYQGYTEALEKQLGGELNDRGEQKDCRGHN